MASPCDKVIQTPKLLEAILLQVDTRTLLVSALLVSRRWNSAILKSTALRCALFFEPDNAAPNDPRVLNSIFVKDFPGFVGKLPGSTSPLKDYDYYHKLALSKQPRAETFRRPNASWRRMLVAQPPVTALYIVDANHASGHELPMTIKINGPKSFPQGFRMGELYDLGLGWTVQNWSTNGFQMLWEKADIREWLGEHRFGRYIAPFYVEDVCSLRDKNGAIFMGHLRDRSGHCIRDYQEEALEASAFLAKFDYRPR